MVCVAHVASCIITAQNSFMVECQYSLLPELQLIRNTCASPMGGWVAGIFMDSP